MKIIRKVIGGFCILEACGGVIAAIAVPEPGLLSVTAVFGFLAWLCFRRPKSKWLPNQEQQFRSAQKESPVEPLVSVSFTPQEVPADILRDMRKYYTKAQAIRDVEILRESFFLAQTTTDIEVFLSRVELACKKAFTLQQAKMAKCRGVAALHPEQAVNAVLGSVQSLKIDFLFRVYEKETQSAMQLKTPRGQRNRLEKFIEKLQEHEIDFTEVEQQYNEVLSMVQSMMPETKNAGEV